MAEIEQIDTKTKKHKRNKKSKKSLKKNNIKNNNLTISVESSNKSPPNLSSVLHLMSEEFPLNDFAEQLEKSSNGKFDIKFLTQQLIKYYPSFSKSAIQNFISNLSLTSLGISYNTPFISLHYLFKYFNDILNQKIYSPSLIIYEIANELKNDFQKSTMEFIYSIGLNISDDINYKEFIKLFSKKLKCDITSLDVLFKCIDCNNKNKILIQDFILVIDSFRDDNQLNNIFINKEISFGLLFKFFFDKNCLNIEKMFSTNEFLTLDEIKSKLLSTLNKSQKIFDKPEPINETIINQILSQLSKENNIYKKDLENYLNYLDDIFNNIFKKINLNETQRKNLKKFLDCLEILSISPDNVFEIISRDEKKQIIKLKDLKILLRNNLPSISISDDEIKEIIDTFDINNIGEINYFNYKNIISEIQTNINKVKNLESKNNPNNNSKNYIPNMYSIGIKSNNLNLLPVKGNYLVLLSLNKKLSELISDEDLNNDNDNFSKEEKLKADQGFLYEEKDSKGKITKYYNNTDMNIVTTRSDVSNIKINDNYNEKYLLKKTIENFKFNNLYFTCFDLFDSLNENSKFSLNDCNEIIKYLDKDCDGYIALIDVINFLLRNLKYRSTKLVYKYLYIMIYKNMQMKTSDDFFKQNNLKINDIIDINVLCKIFRNINIEFPLTKKIYDEINNIYDPPFIYKHICELIDEYKDDPFINNNLTAHQKIFMKKEKNLTTKDFDEEIKNLVNNLSNLNNNIKNKKNNHDDITKAKNIRNNLKNILSNCENLMNYNQFIKKFAEPLNIDPILSLVLFQLIKNFNNKGKQLISKNDLLLFLESYSCESDISNLYHKNNRFDVQNIVEDIEKHGPPLKYAFEIIPYRNEGVIPCSELSQYLNKFYNNSIAKKDLMQIINYMDRKRRSMVSYTQILKFLKTFSQSHENFSPHIEILRFACILWEKNYDNAEDYFMEEFSGINKYKKEINERRHNLLMEDLSSSEENKQKLFYYFTSLYGKNYYDLQYLIDIINGYLELDPDNNNLEFDGNNIININISLPDKEIFEKAIKKLNLGEYGYLSVNEILMKFGPINRKKLIGILDPKLKGFISFPEFVTFCRKKYGMDCNINLKLCAQYLFKVFIKKAENIQNYLIKKSNADNLYTYLTGDECRNYFMFAFCNDNNLFENFFTIYKEKMGKNRGKLNLKSIERFILLSNEIIDTTNSTNNNENEYSKNIIKDIFGKKLLTTEDIINKIQVPYSGLEKDFTINLDYFSLLLKNELKLNVTEINIICSYFKFEQNKFDLKKFFLYNNENLKNIDIIIQTNMIPKIKSHIQKCSKTSQSYKEYKTQFLSNKDFLDICELYSKFNLMYQFSLYQCLLLMNNEQFFSVDKFYNELKNEFPIKNFDPTLKIALIRLNDYFDKNKDKLKIFKQFDIDKNGVLSSEEFMTFLNSMKDLNINDNQKYKLLSIADTNNDGKINSKEFLKFVKSINIYNSAEISLEKIPSLQNTGKNNIVNDMIFFDMTELKNNLKYNKLKLKNEENEFLSLIVILQEDLNNSYDDSSIQNEFINVDQNNNGIINANEFKSILQNKLMFVKEEYMIKFINMASRGLDESYENERDYQKVNYKNFLKNIGGYKYDFKGNEKYEERVNVYPKKKLPKIN